VARVANVSPPPKSVESSHPRFPSLQWWVRDEFGKLALAHLPNPALAVWLVTVVVGWTGLLASDRADTVKAIGQGALIVWALDELVRGSSPARRVLGAVVLVVQVLHLFR
jgi:hypothetical protein